MIQQARQRHLDTCLGQPEAGAPPPAGAEGHQLEVLPPEVHGAAGEPLRQKLLGVLPRRGVPADGPRVDHHARARRDVVTPVGTGVVARPPAGGGSSGELR
ncbi:hypothetical protein SEVIR_5G010101v4 [Setaria viridis]